MSDNQNTFDQFCIVELFGHQVIAGKVSEQTIGGAALIRVDVPETEMQPGFTRFYGAGAIYSITPVSEDVALLAVKRFQAKPITVYMPELNKQLEAGSEDQRDYLCIDCGATLNIDGICSECH